MAVFVELELEIRRGESWAGSSRSALGGFSGGIFWADFVANVPIAAARAIRVRRATRVLSNWLQQLVAETTGRLAAMQAVGRTM